MEGNKCLKANVSSSVFQQSGLVQFAILFQVSNNTLISCFLLALPAAWSATLRREAFWHFWHYLPITVIFSLIQCLKCACAAQDDSYSVWRWLIRYTSNDKSSILWTPPGQNIFWSNIILMLGCPAQLFRLHRSFSDAGLNMCECDPPHFTTCSFQVTVKITSLTLYYVRHHDR